MTISWEEVWKELQDGLKHQPLCPIDKEYPHIPTLSLRSINDILEVGEKEVRVRSHNPKGERKKTKYEHT